MPNLTNKNLSEIHKSIVNIGGANNGVISDSLQICDGNGFSTGLGVSSSEISINSRRGYLSNFTKKGFSTCKLYSDLFFPNGSLSSPVAEEQSIFVADLDRYAYARIHFIRDDFDFKIGLRSKYFDQAPDNEPNVVGYWQRSYGRLNYYFVIDNEVRAIDNLDESLYFLDPSPQSSNTLLSGLIKKYGEFNGMRHPKAEVSFKFILSCEEGLNISISDEIRKIRDFETNESVYRSISGLLSYPNITYMYEKINFTNFNLSKTPQVFELKFFNPVLWSVQQDVFFDDTCAYYGKEVAPNVDLRLYYMAQTKMLMLKH